MRCEEDRPELRVVQIDGVPASHRVACHWAEQIASGEVRRHEVAVEDVTHPDEAHPEIDSTLGAKGVTDVSG